MTNNKPQGSDAFNLSDYFKVGSLAGYKGLRIIRIEEDGYLNVKTALPTGAAFVALYPGEAFLPNGASSTDDELETMSVVHAGPRGLHGVIEWSGVWVAPVPATNLIYRDSAEQHRHPSHPGDSEHRFIGPYEVCDQTAEYWITPDTLSE
jgi:hypothetical protein